MRTYPADDVCAFRFTRAAWGELSNFCPLPTAIVAGPWSFATSEHLYQAAKFAGRPEIQQRIANAPTPREAAAIGRTRGLGMNPAWPTERVNAMRWVLRMKHQSNQPLIDRVLAETGDRPIVEISARDDWWGARPAGAEYRGRNVLGRLWMELRQHLRDRAIPTRAPERGSNAPTWVHSPRPPRPGPTALSREKL